MYQEKTTKPAENSVFLAGETHNAREIFCFSMCSDQKRIGKAFNTCSVTGCTMRKRKNEIPQAPQPDPRSINRAAPTLLKEILRPVLQEQNKKYNHVFGIRKIYG